MTTSALFAASVAARRYKDGAPMPLPLVCLGLAGETGELVEAYASYLNGETQQNHAVVAELGDVLWYATAALQLNGVSIEAAIWHGMTTEAVALVAAVGLVCDMVKKDRWHGQPANVGALVDNLLDVVAWVERIAVLCESSLDKVMQANMEKLDRRYPNGFCEGGGDRG